MFSLVPMLLLALAPPDSLPFDLSSPTRTLVLPDDDLDEISGLGPTDHPDRFCAIDDERGEVFIIDLAANGAVTDRILFRDKGDFEGVEWVGHCLYAVRSDGTIFEITECSGGYQVNDYDTELEKTDDIEALAYDPGRRALLVGCKGSPDNADLRRVFAFDLKTKKLSKAPVYTIDPTEVNRLVPYNDQDKRNFFSPSAMAIQPGTGDLYVLSSSLKRLLVLDGATGTVRHAARLDKKLLPQPEGMCFDHAGNLWISSEAKDGLPARLLRFDAPAMAGKTAE